MLRSKDPKQVMGQVIGQVMGQVMDHYIRFSVKSTAHLFIVLTSSVSDTTVPSELSSSSITLLLYLRRRLSEDVTILSSDNSLHLSISRVVKATLSLSLKALVI